MTLAAGVSKSVAIKLETTPGALAGATGAQLLRNVTSTLDLKKDILTSTEKVATMQEQDVRHGVRRPTGALNGLLSPATYKMPIQSVFRRNFTSGATTSALTTVTAAAGPPGTFTRSAGSFLTDGFKIGDIVRWSGWTTTATGNNARNYRITALTATVMTVGTSVTGATGGAEIVAAKTAGDSVTCAVVGKKTFIPTSGQTLDTYSYEHWFSDIAQSEVFIGVQFAQMKLSLPPSGNATVTFQTLGRDLGSSGTSEYFTSPTAITSTTILAAVNGTLRVAGADAAIVTGLDLTLDLGLSGDPAVGSNTLPWLFPDVEKVTGQFTAFFVDNTLRDLFVNETESTLSFAFTTNNTITADFINIVMSRIKFTGADKNDGTKGIVQTFPFRALLDLTGGAGQATENTAISLQDSAA